MFDFFRVWRQRKAEPEPPTRPGGRPFKLTFSDDVRHVLADARMHALYAGKRALAPSHILLALLHRASAAFDRLGIDRAALRDRVEEPPAGKQPPLSATLPYDSAAKKVLEQAMAEAWELRHAEVGVDHLLAGIARGDSPAARALADVGVTLPALRAALWPTPPPGDG